MHEYLEKHYQCKIRVEAVNLHFLRKYFLFLINNKKLSHNTTVRSLGLLRILLNNAIKSNSSRKSPFSELKVKLHRVYRQFLTQQEIAILQSINLSNDVLERKKDVFMFACFTGLAYSVIKQLKNKHISRDKDCSCYIRKPRQ